jgi:DNA (cytosine-5)-methyltransferase 1
MDTYVAEFVKSLFNISCDKNGNNTQMTSKLHHKTFINILHTYEFSELNITTKKIREILKLNSTIKKPNGRYYIEEPFGSQNAPDFLLLNIYDGTIKTLKFELKTGRKKIMWNDGYPKKDTIYLYTDNKLCKSVLYVGKYLLNADTQKVLNKYLKLIKDMNISSKLELSKCSKNASGFKIYVRKANSQSINILSYSEIDLLNFKKQIYYKFINFINITHISNKIVMNQKKGISLFSGAGGDTIGMTNAGMDIVGFVEYDDDAIQTHLLNYPNSKLIGKNICDITDEKFQEYTNIDVIFGGFPCQSFSHGGKKNPSDPRGQLYKEFVRATRLIKPKFILGENVKGILTRKNINGNLFTSDIIKDFKDIGYSMIHKLIKCEKFGVPQKRMRVFFIGINDEFLQEQKLDINDILINLPDTNNENNTIRSICEFSLVNALKVEKQKFLDIIPENKVIKANPESEDDIANISGSVATNLLKCYEERSNHGLSFSSRSKSTFSGIEDLDKQTHTILCAYNRMPRLFIPMKNSNGIFLRPFNIKELKQIQGFPVDYQFSGSDSSIVKQIGNAVPSVVVKCIITYLLTFL